ncbi:MAG: c-type cytochrome [Campylobacterales bacterium]
MKELKILAIVVAIVGVIYYGVEPYAHHIMHPEVTPPDFKFSDLPVMKTDGDPAHGKEVVQANCVSCHSITKEGIAAPMDAASAGASYGVTPPDLSNVGAIYDANYLANFIADPTKASQLPEGKTSSMPALGLSEGDIADAVAYLRSIADKNLTPQQITHEACGRCHSIRYEKFAATTPNKDDLKRYLGSVPPDLSQMIKSAGHHYLEGFINQPQKLLPGTGMPRVGLTEEAQKKVIEHLEKVGDPKKDERERLGLWFILYFAIFTVIAYLWKVKQFRKVH